MVCSKMALGVVIYHEVMLIELGAKKMRLFIHHFSNRLVGQSCQSIQERWRVGVAVSNCPPGAINALNLQAILQEEVEATRHLGIQKLTVE